MKKLLVVVDMQKDFVTGALGTEQAKKIVPDIAAFIDKWDGDVCFTRDTHDENYMETQEGKRLPVPHCIDGTDGWNIVDALTRFVDDDTVIMNKPTFGSVALARWIRDIGYQDVYFCGVCTGICVISNAVVLKAHAPEVNITTIADLCACVNEETHETALNAMRTLQIDVKNVNEI